MSGKQKQQQDWILDIYVGEVMVEEVFDKETEIGVMLEIRRMQAQRWVELLTDLHDSETFDEGIFKTIDEKKVRFEKVWESLGAPNGLEPFLHPDTIWNIEVLNACIDQLKHRFIKANLRLVVEIAKRYDFGLVPLLDLIQEGNIGLLSAVDRFDPTLGFRFSTFAYSWIRHPMRKALAHSGHTVRVPVRVVDNQYRLRSTVDRFELEHGRPPVENELAREMGLSVTEVNRIQNQPVVRVYPIDNNLPEFGFERYISLSIDRSSPCPHDSIMLKTLMREKKRIFEVLSAIEKAIVCWRFGLDDGNEMTLRQIGERCHLSKERIRQILIDALYKLRLAFDGT